MGEKSCKKFLLLIYVENLNFIHLIHTILPENRARRGTGPLRRAGRPNHGVTGTRGRPHPASGEPNNKDREQKRLPGLGRAEVSVSFSQPIGI